MKKLVLAFALLIVGTSIIKAQNIESAKAKFIYNFTNFFEWPQSERTGDFVIGVMGSSDVYSELKSYTQGKKVIVQNIKVKKFNSLNDVSDCHMLFVSKFQINKLDDLKQKLTSKTLFISDSEKGIQKGAAINFILKGNRLSYEFAASNAMSNGLKFSSRVRDMASKNH